MKISFTALARRGKWLSRWHPYLGPACWILTVQYFVVQIAAAMANKSAYNWGIDPISYLGITECGVFYGEYVCSPLHAVFNLSMIGLGMSMAAGAFLLYHQFKRSRGTLLGFGALGAAAVGAILIGVFPANTLVMVHKLGAGMAFVGGLSGMLILSIALRGLYRPLRYALLCSGIISLLGLMLLALVFFLHMDFTGAAERISSYPVVLGLIVFGICFCTRHLDGHASQ